MALQIRIVRRPMGEAPPEIRDAWIGLVLPVAEGQKKVLETGAFGVLSMPRSSPGRILNRLLGRTTPYRGYTVEPQVAVEILRTVNPQAADWWLTNAAHLFRKGLRLMFEEECCEVESTS